MPTPLTLPFTTDAFFEAFARDNVALWPGVGLSLCALAYPLVNVLAGHEYPASPTFGVKCPTGILTAGFLLTAATPPIAVLVVPVVWSLVGGSASLVLSVAADDVLLACTGIRAASDAYFQVISMPKKCRNT